LADREQYHQALLADSRCRYTVLAANSVATALEMSQETCIDAILVSDGLTDATGLDVVQALQRQSAERGAGIAPPVVMLASEENLGGSVAVAVHNAVHAMKRGVADYLLKSTLTPEQLRLTIQEAIQTTRSRLPLPEQEELSRIQQLNRDLAHRVAELQTLIDIIPIGIAIAPDPACTEMQCNAYIRDLLGVGPDHNISKSAPVEEQPSFRVFQNGEELPSEDLPMQIAARLGVEVRDAEIEIVLPDGTIHQLLSYASPLRNNQNEIRGSVGAFLDITERNRMEAELRDRETIIRQQLAELESIYVTAPVGLCFQDPELRYVRINERLAEINGIPASEHLGHTLREVLPELADTIEPLHRHVIQTGEPILNVEVRGTTKAQPEVERDWIASYHPLKDVEGRVLGVNVVVQDITELKQVQAEREQLVRQLETERSLLEQTLQQMPLGVAIAAAPWGKLLFHNDEAIRLIRHPMQVSETYSGYAQYGALHADGQPYRPDEYPIARAILSGEVVKSEEMSYRRGDGTETLFSVSAAPIVDQAGERIAAVSTFEDISERKQIEVERIQLLAKAEAANRSKDEFVAVVAHELRSPLNAIMGWAKLLQTRQLDAATITKALETITRNTEAQVQLVEDLLDISRMVRGTFQLTLASVNLVHVVETALETIRPAADAKQLQLVAHLHPVPPIAGDFNRLQQVILNLLTNAIKFTSEAGQVQVWLDQHQSKARIRLTDTGKGISPEFLPHIFERFRQDQHSTTAKQGLGLGLAIVQHLVKLHGGTITAESQGEGKGATFTIELPLESSTAGREHPLFPSYVAEPINGRSSVQQPHPSHQHPSYQHPSHQPFLSSPIRSSACPQLTDLRVLLVDDEPDMLNLTAFILEQHGAVVQTATSAKSALEVLAQFHPDILLSDLAMPEQDGYGLLRQVRSIQPEGQIPAIALTAYASYTRYEESLRVGFQQHLTKPVEPEKLVSAILSTIERGSHCV
ncbi:MAG TPA: ATP-binding protein, partial [Allocoleopsis sp.]